MVSFCNKIIRVVCIVFLSIAFMKSYAFAKETLEADYELYSKGINIATMRLTVTFEGDTYTVKRSVKTHGLASLFKLIDISGNVTGKIDKKRFITQKYDTQSVGDSKYHTSTIWNKSGKITVTPKGNYSLSKKTLARLQKASLDTQLPVTEELTSMFYFHPDDKANICKGTVRVFTGIRVYDHQYKNLQGYVKLAEVSKRTYSGDGYVCSRRKINIAGYGNGNGKPDDDGIEKIWLGNVQLDGRNLLLLVQLQQEKKGLGTVLGYLTQLTHHKGQ